MIILETAITDTCTILYHIVRQHYLKVLQQSCPSQIHLLQSEQPADYTFVPIQHICSVALRIPAATN